MEHQQLKELIYNTAVEVAAGGYGWAQERIVLHKIAEKMGIGEKLALQQAVLTAWHELFLEKRLSWGYDLDNPNAPFFHVPQNGHQPHAASHPAAVAP